MRETGHKSQRQEVRLRSDRKNPAMWVAALLHTRYLLRVLLERGYLGVYDDCDLQLQRTRLQLQQNRQQQVVTAQAACSPELSVILREVFLKTGLVAQAVAVPDTPLRRTRTRKKRRPTRASVGLGSRSGWRENEQDEEEGLDDDDGDDDLIDEDHEPSAVGHDEEAAYVGPHEWISRRTNPPLLFGGGTEKAIMQTMTGQFLSSLIAATWASFKRIKRKPIDSFRNAKWTAEEGSALQLRPAWRGRSQPGRQDGDFYLYVVRHIFGCLADMALIRQNKQIRGGALALNEAGEGTRVSFAMLYCEEFRMQHHAMRSGRYAQMPCDFFERTGQMVLVDPKLVTGVRRVFHACTARCQQRRDKEAGIEHDAEESRIVAHWLYAPQQHEEARQ